MLGEKMSAEDLLNKIEDLEDEYDFLLDIDPSFIEFEGRKRIKMDRISAEIKELKEQYDLLQRQNIL